MCQKLLVWTFGLLVLNGCTSMGANGASGSRTSKNTTENRNPPWGDVWGGSRTETAPEAMPENVRLAQAQVAGDADVSRGEPVKGFLQFEQMPNSVIISYRLEGLTPKRDYQIFVKEKQGCRPSDLSPAVGLKGLKGNKSGVSENTFTTADFSVSGKQSLLGKTVVIATRESDAEMSASIPLACGQVLPVGATPAAE
jgi:hypothetical protein